MSSYSKNLSSRTVWGDCCLLGRCPSCPNKHISFFICRSASIPSRRTVPVPEGLPEPLLLDIVIAAQKSGFDLAIALLFRYQEEQEKARRL